MKDDGVLGQRLLQDHARRWRLGRRAGRLLAGCIARLWRALLLEQPSRNDVAVGLAPQQLQALQAFFEQACVLQGVRQRLQRAPALWVGALWVGLRCTRMHAPTRMLHPLACEWRCLSACS
jgi:hypothetical protein